MDGNALRCILKHGVGDCLQRCSWSNLPSRHWHYKPVTTSRSCVSATTRQWSRGTSLTGWWRWPVVMWLSSSTVTTTQTGRQRCWHVPVYWETRPASTSAATRTSTSATHVSFACRWSHLPPSSPSTTVRISDHPHVTHSHSIMFTTCHVAMTTPSIIRHFWLSYFAFCAISLSSFAINSLVLGLSLDMVNPVLAFTFHPAIKLNDSKITTFETI